MRAPPLHLLFVLFVSFVVPSFSYAALRAGAYAQDITPTQFPVIVNGGFTEAIATKANDTLHARAIVLDDGREKLALVVVDSCMLPRDLLDDAKTRANKLTNIPVNHILISATHSHTAPSSMGCLGSDADANYVKVLPDLLARAIEQANQKLAPAQIAFTVVNDPDHTAARRWVFRPDRMRIDPFGELTVRANMHPGYLSPDAIGPTGPIDPGLSILSIQHADGRPLALLANYSMHYVGTTPLSGDYYGRFADNIAKLLKADENFVGIMSQGTSGDMWLADYSKPQPTTRPTIDTFATALATEVAAALKDLKYDANPDLAMRETTLKLGRRIPDEKRLAWAKEKVAALGDKKLKLQPDIYAREAIFLHDDPERELKLQAIRIGNVAIAAIPNEVYALTGLKLKAMSPLTQTFTMSLANGSEGYIPPPEQHKLGGYTTWPARTAALEPQAEPRITEAILKLLEDVTAQKRRQPREPKGPYAQTVLKSNPAAYWRMDEFAGLAHDITGHGLHGIYEDGVLFHLPGAPSSAITGDAAQISRAAHFAGGRLKIVPQALEQPYSVEFFVWNGLANEARPITAYLFSRGEPNDKDAGDHLGIAGTLDDSAHIGQLIFTNGNPANQLLAGKTVLAPRTWHHVIFTRDNDKVRAWLDGNLEIEGNADLTTTAEQLYFGGRADNVANLEGKLDEISLYRRAITQQEVTAHVQAAALPSPNAQPPSPARANNPSLTPPTQPRVGEGRGEGQPSTTQAAPYHPPRSPADSMKTFHLPPNLTIDLVASEPLISSPVAIDWGNDGKLWVVEMADYPYGMDGKGKPGGRIKYLESTKDNQTYDKATLFLDNIKMPNGILAWRNGVIVTAATEIFYAEDTDQDGKADKRELLFKGFKEGNPQLRQNGLRPGLDNWIYVASGLTGGTIESTKTGEKLDLKGHDLRIRPDTGEMELVSGPSQFGREQNNAGQWFGTDNSHPLFHYVLEDRYLKRNPYLTSPDPKNQLLPLPLPPVFPKSPFAKRYIGLDHHGHFTSACGISLYRDDLLFKDEGGRVKDESEKANAAPLPSDSSFILHHSSFPLHAFICEPVHNLIQHQLLIPAGATFTAKRIEGEPNSDFLAAEDNWFRPVMTRTGPDGALYVVDMYRFMIEHPDWLNETGKKELAPFYRNGENRGRIYRIHPKNVPPRPIPRLDHLTTEQLVKVFESPSGYLRDRAQMTLLWKADPAAVPALEQLLPASPNPLARLHALCTLDGFPVADPKSTKRNPRSEILLGALADPHPAVRAHAIRLCEGRPEGELLAALVARPDDPDPFVRVQLACTFGQFDSAAAGLALANLVRNHPDDLLLATAAASSAMPHRRYLAAEVLSHPALLGSGALFHQLVAISAALNDRPAVAAFIDAAAKAPDTDAAMIAMARIADVLAGRGQTLDQWVSADGSNPNAAQALDRLAAQASRMAADATADPRLRLASVEMLGRLRERRADDLDVASALLAPAQPVEVQLAAVRAAARCERANVPQRLLKGWPAHSPTVRAAVADALLARAPWTLELAASPAARDLDFARRQRLLNHANKDVKAAAQRTIARSLPANADRQKVIDTYQPALTLPGDPAHGQALFAENCATCHRMGNSPVGHDLGPNLLTVRDWPKENILTALLDPDRTVEPRFIAYTATLNDGSALTGLLTTESAGNVIVKTLDDIDHPLPRSALKSLISTNRSLMPQGFEAALQPQDVADLMSYIQSPSPPK
ncbi:MAG: hypothetical protein JWN40_2466 [Phycisphaerales bacterium]|nr:hypothetical protein [Phycisphaerales bacterium]